MNDRTHEYSDNSEELLMSDDLELLDADLEDEEDANAYRSSRQLNMDIRHRIEERMEQRRLMRELGEYEFMDLDEDDTLH